MPQNYNNYTGPSRWLSLAIFLVNVAIRVNASKLTPTERTKHQTSIIIVLFYIFQWSMYENIEIINGIDNRYKYFCL